MRTTEVFIEQLLIGLLVLSAAGALLHPPLFDMIAGAELGALALLGAAAYLTGIAYDRFADTLLAGLEGHHRLSFALSKGRGPSERQVPPDDPYPENLYRLSLLESGEATEYAHYLRTRMRLTRAMATLGPLLGAGAAAYLLGSGTVKLLLTMTSVTGYGLAFLLALLASQETPAAAPGGGWRPWYELPRTSDAGQLRIYEVRTAFEGEGPQTDRWLGLLLTGTWAVPLLLGITLANWIVLWGEGISPLGLLPWAGFLLSLIFGWVWWRITHTFFQFVRDHHLYRHAPAPTGPESPVGPHLA